MDDLTRRRCLEPTPAGAAAFVAWAQAQAATFGDALHPYVLVLHAADDGMGALELLVLVHVAPDELARAIRTRARTLGAVAVALFAPDVCVADPAPGRPPPRPDVASLTLVVEHAGAPQAAQHREDGAPPGGVLLQAWRAMVHPGGTLGELVDVSVPRSGYAAVPGYLIGPWLAR